MYHQCQFGSIVNNFRVWKKRERKKIKYPNLNKYLGHDSATKRAKQRHSHCRFFRPFGALSHVLLPILSHNHPFYRNIPLSPVLSHCRSPHISSVWQHCRQFCRTISRIIALSLSRPFFPTVALPLSSVLSLYHPFCRSVGGEITTVR